MMLDVALQTFENRFVHCFRVVGHTCIKGGLVMAAHHPVERFKQDLRMLPKEQRYKSGDKKANA